MPGTGQRNSDIGVRFVSDEAKRDHRDLEGLHHKLIDACTAGEGGGGEGENKNERTSELQNRFCWALARHLITMHLFVFPGTESRAKAGSQIAGDRKKESALIRDQLVQFAQLVPHDPDFKASAERIGQFLRPHIQRVERTDIVAIEKALNGEESERMARHWERTEFFVPLSIRRDSNGGGDGDWQKKDAPYKTVEELMSAPLEDVRKLWEKLER